MFTKSRKIVALGMVVTVATAGVAIAGGTGAEENDAVVDGKVTPSKLSKKKFTPVNLFLGVRNSSDQIDGAQENPASEVISVSKNVKINLGKTPECEVDFDNGTPIDTAREACPPKSYLGKGVGEVTAPATAADCIPSGQPCVVATPDIAVFHGPAANQVQLVTYDADDLGALSPVVDGTVINSPHGAAYGQALNVPDAPETGTIMITKFNATIMKSRKVATARCKPKAIKYRREVTYDDASSEFANKTQKCKIKR